MTERVINGTRQDVFVTINRENILRAQLIKDIVLKI